MRRNLMRENSSETLFCKGVPDRAHLYFASKAKTAFAVLQDLSLMLCASSSTMRRHRTAWRGLTWSLLPAWASALRCASTMRQRSSSMAASSAPVISLSAARRAARWAANPRRRTSWGLLLSPSAPDSSSLSEAISSSSSSDSTSPGSKSESSPSESLPLDLRFLPLAGAAACLLPFLLIKWAPFLLPAPPALAALRVTSVVAALLLPFALGLALPFFGASSSSSEPSSAEASLCCAAVFLRRLVICLARAAVFLAFGPQKYLR
mmetsp:Transcript_12990/g.39321  ORF Transcript_12990/g.39321 Transcript_12990/m.39321 type:complete len:264 (+) Transcript_12990:1595-2386(+)